MTTSTKDMLDLIHEAERPAYEAELDQILETVFPADAAMGHEWRFTAFGTEVYLPDTGYDHGDDGWVAWSVVREYNERAAREMHNGFMESVHGRTESGEYCYGAITENDEIGCGEEEKIEPNWIVSDRALMADPATAWSNNNDHGLRHFNAYMEGGNSHWYRAGLNGEIPVDLINACGLSQGKKNWRHHIPREYLNAYDMGQEHAAEIEWS